MINHSKILETLFSAYTPTWLALHLGISKQAVHQWTQIPAGRARKIEKLTGIPREKLRPDIYGDEP